MDAKQFTDILNQYAEENTPYPEDFWFDVGDPIFNEPTEVRANVVTVEAIDKQLGGEDVFPGGQGEIYVVLKLTVDGREQFFKRSGTYASHCGTDWDDELVEVFPKQKSITVYERE